MAKKTSNQTDKPTQPTEKATAPKKASRTKSAASSTGKATKSATKKAAKKAATKKAAPKKAAAKKAAAPAKPAARKTAAKKATTRRATPARKAAKKSAPVEDFPTLEAPPLESADEGVIRPAAKRPAQKLPINGAVLYRQQRESTQKDGDHAPEATAPAELPEAYGKTRLSALVRDAEWIFAYWEFSPETRRTFKLDDQEGSRGLTLRLYDITGIDFDGTNAHSHTDVPIGTLANSWYLHVPASGRHYIVEIGLLTNTGFTTIARSRPVQMPANSISDSGDWDMTPEQEEAHRQILRLSGGPNLPSGLSSAEFATSWNARFFEESAGFSGVLFSGGIANVGELSSGAVVLKPPPGKDRGFWLKVDAEVIVYGATDPNAKVRFMGRDIRIGPDGTFGIRMALPDGTIEFPVEATSPDERETRSVCPIVIRRTN